MGKICPLARNRDPLRFIAVRDLLGLFVSLHLYHSHANCAFVRVCNCLRSGIVWVCLRGWMSGCTSLVEFADRKERIGKVHETVTLCPLWQRLSKPSCLCSYPPLPSRLVSFSPPIPSVLPPVPLLSLTEVISLPPSLPLSSSVSPLLISVIPSILFSFCFTPFFSLSFSAPLLSRVHCFVFLCLPHLSFFFFASRNAAFFCHHPISSAFLCSTSVNWWNTSWQPLVIHSDSFPSDICPHVHIACLQFQSSHSNLPHNHWLPDTHRHIQFDFKIICRLVIPTQSLLHSVWL